MKTETKKQSVSAIIPIAKVNNVELEMISEGRQKFVAIKPICEALGVAYPPQFQKIKDDVILGSTVTLRVTVGADGKKREMAVLPLEYIFGWLFTINPQNVDPEARESVVAYKLECYNALFNYFINRVNFLEDKAQRVALKTQKRFQIRKEFSTAKSKLHNVEKELTQAVKLTYEEWEKEQSQMELDFNSDNKDINEL